MKSSVTRDEVARAAGVSPATVSYVVNNGPRPVAAETRTRVRETIKRLGYRPNAVAQSLRRRRTSMIGLILPDTHNPYFSEVARGIESVTFERGYTVVLCHSGYDVEHELKYVEVLHSERAAGVIWIPATDNHEPGERLVDFGVPLVILDRVVPGIQAPSVVADNFRGGYLATEHLIGLGHRRIGCIGRPLDLSHSRERFRGYCAALKDHEIPQDETLLVRGGLRLEDGRVAALRLLNLTSPPTAIFAYNDIMAIGALRAAFERGLKVPRDLSIVGFDNIPQAAYTCPALTTVRQLKLDMGRQGAELLLDLVENKALPESRTPVDVKLVVRESTGPIGSIASQFAGTDGREMDDATR